MHTIYLVIHKTEDSEFNKIESFCGARQAQWAADKLAEELEEKTGLTMTVKPYSMPE